jgi:hypothetical protein
MRRGVERPVQFWFGAGAWGGSVAAGFLATLRHPASVDAVEIVEPDLQLQTP